MIPVPGPAGAPRPRPTPATVWEAKTEIHEFERLITYLAFTVTQCFAIE